MALFNVNGTLHAIDGTCTHRGGPLREGELDGIVVTCPWHGARFDVTERVEKDVEASEGSKWLVASLKVRSDKASCDAAEIVLTVPGGGAFAAVGIATQPSNGFINLESLPLGVGRGPSAWSVLRGSSGRVTFAAAGPEATFHVLFAVLKAATAVMLKLCSIGTAKVPPSEMSRAESVKHTGER